MVGSNREVTPARKNYFFRGERVTFKPLASIHGYSSMSRSTDLPSTQLWQFDPKDFPVGQNEPFERMYRRYYPQYKPWAHKRWGGADHDIAEAFNEAVLIFRKKVWEGSMEGYRGKAVNTILFAFAANVIRNHFKRSQQHRDRFAPLPDQIGEMEVASDVTVEEALQGPLFRQVPEGKMALLKAGMDQLSERCRNLLMLRIVHGLSMPDIADQMGLANADTAKTAKNKCLKRLRSLLGR